MFFGVLCVIVVAWFSPVYRANSFLQQAAVFRPGVTETTQVEELERRGLLHKLSKGCIGGFEHPSETPLEADARAKNGEVCYGFMFRNTLLETLHLAPPTSVYGTLTVSHRKLALLRLALRQGSLIYVVSDLDCDLCTPHHSNYGLSRQLNGLEGTPGNTYVELTRGSSQQERRNAYAINLSVLRKIGRVKDGRDLNPSVWQQPSPQEQ